MTGSGRLAVYCADIGSERSGAFGWAFGRPGEAPSPGGSKIEDLAARVAADLEAGIPVALGFECPLFVPIPSESARLGGARVGEGNRPWSAAAGAAVLATGLAQVPWILEAIRRRVSRPVPVALRWDGFRAGQPGLLLWEAFVSGEGKAESHVEDAQRAVELFLAAWPDLGRANIVSGAEVFSLVGAALLRTGWSNDVTLLSTPCLVVGARREPRAGTVEDEPLPRSRGSVNSMRTRVVPVFSELIRRDPTGVSWLPALLGLVAGIARRDLGSVFAGPLLEARFGETERPLAPPRSLLQWLVEHPESLNRPKDKEKQPAKRISLLSGSSRAREEARVRLSEVRVPERAWYVLEGASYPDVFLRTRSGIIVIEGKRTEADVTTSTTWMPVRHQMLRHLDGAWDLQADHQVIGLFIVEGDGDREATAVPAHWIERCATTVQPEVLAASLPHRSDAARLAIAAAYAGVTTWQAVCEKLGVSYQGLPGLL